MYIVLVLPGYSEEVKVWRFKQTSTTIQSNFRSLELPLPTLLIDTTVKKTTWWKSTCYNVHGLAIVKVQNQQKVWMCFTLKQVNPWKCTALGLTKKTCPTQSPSFLLQFKTLSLNPVETSPPIICAKTSQIPTPVWQPTLHRKHPLFLGWFLKKVQEARFSTMERKGRNISATALSPPLGGRYRIRWGSMFEDRIPKAGRLMMLKQHPVPGVFSRDVQNRHVEAQQRNKKSG